METYTKTKAKYTNQHTTKHIQQIRNSQIQNIPNKYNKTKHTKHTKHSKILN